MEKMESEMGCESGFEMGRKDSGGGGGIFLVLGVVAMVHMCRW
jgi:hypothetical protein